MFKAKKKYQDSASEKERKSFSSYLSEDEELVVATGYGTNFMRHRFALYLTFPGFILIFGSLGWAYFFSLNYGYALLVGLLLAFIIAWIKSSWTYHSHRYLLTTRRVILKEGFFAVKLKSALYDKITHIEVDQSLVDRLIMKHGTVIIHTAGASKDELRVEYIDAPIEFKNLLERLINRERERIGGSSGPVVTLEGELVE